MKEVVFLKDNQRQQLIRPAKGEQFMPLEQPVETEPGECQTRNVCGKSNSSIGGSEDILF
ncbi:MAG TPA: hypothetical protein VM802_01760 [Chitinophaga sp.]|uniref:hypothetical protein n=1 Tax=Chitinophaga sp. TaxID=1869181 RepID=UPI002BFD743A|nr:hypothetical protein [Chitinophaga sp.]HVI43558.1 hypothetical protein [Chitinophaga sp.]